MFSRRVQLFLVTQDERLEAQIAAVAAGGFSRFRLKSSPYYSVEEMLAQSPLPTVILLDFRNNPMYAVAFAKRLRKLEKTRFTPIVFLVEDACPLLVETLRLELTDFLLFPLDTTKFAARIRAIMCHRDVIRRLEQQNQVLSHLAAFDDLTGLYNRRYILNSLGSDVLNGDPEKGGVGMFLIDLDNFKQVNDQCGHLAGDRVLLDFARLLTSCLRSVDIVGRYGGDEFCIVKPEASPGLCAAMARRVLECIAEQSFGPADDCDVPVTASIGVAYAAPGVAKSAQALIAAADKGLYQAKQAGGNQFVMIPMDPVLAAG